MIQKTFFKTALKAALAALALAGLFFQPAAAEERAYTGPAFTADRLYVGDLSGGFHAIDRETGAIVWSRQFEGPSIFPPAVTAEVIAVPVLSGRMVGLDPAIGEDLWSFAVGDVDYEIRDPLVNAGGEIVGDGLLFSSEDFNVYMLDLATGEERWRVTLGEETQARDIPVVDGVAYIGAWDGYLYAIDVARGEILWKSETENDHIGEVLFSMERHNYFVSARTDGETLPKQLPFVSAAPVIRDDRVFFADSAGNLLAVEKETGKQIWWFRPEDLADERFVGPRYFIAEHEGVVYYSTVEDKRLFGVDAATGEEVWRDEADMVTYGPMDITQGVGVWVRVPNEDWPKTELVAFDMATREILWTTREVAGLVPFLEDGAAYFGFFDGTIRGFDIRSGEEVQRFTPVESN